MSSPERTGNQPLKVAVLLGSTRTQGFEPQNVGQRVGKYTQQNFCQRKQTNKQTQERNTQRKKQRKKEKRTSQNKGERNQNQTNEVQYSEQDRVNSISSVKILMFHFNRFLQMDCPSCQRLWLWMRLCIRSRRF